MGRVGSRGGIRVHPAVDLLRSRQAFWQRVAAGEEIGRTVAGLSGFIVLASAIYGPVLAGWRSWQLALYVALKFPLLLIGTASLVMLLNWIVATAFGSGLRFGQVVAATYGALAIACWILLAMAPVAAFFTVAAAPAGGPAVAQRMTHHCLLLTQVVLIAGAGLAGNAALRRGLARVVAPGCSARRVYWGWIAGFAVVGCQLSWILRPFFGSPFLPVAFLRPDALERNFIEVVFFGILPCVLRGGE